MNSSKPKFDSNIKEELLKYKRKLDLPEHISKKEMTLLKKGVPIQKIVGFVNFDDLKIFVDHNVLIPRYETQEVVLRALKFIRAFDTVLDLCAGSGYIGLTIKQKRPNVEVTLSDISTDSIKQIRENAIHNKLTVNIKKSNLFKKIKGDFNVIVVNPPYVDTKYKLPYSIKKFEPQKALLATDGGLFFYKKIIKNAPKFLKRKGWLVFEIFPEAKSFFLERGFIIEKDINGNDRIAYKQFNL